MKCVGRRRLFVPSPDFHLPHTEPTVRAGMRWLSEPIFVLFLVSLFCFILHALSSYAEPPSPACTHCILKRWKINRAATLTFGTRARQTRTYAGSIVNRIQSIPFSGEREVISILNQFRALMWVRASEWVCVCCSRVEWICGAGARMNRLSHIWLYLDVQEFTILVPAPNAAKVCWNMLLSESTSFYCYY